LPIIFAPGESLKKVKKFKRMKNYDIRQNWLKLKFFHNIEELSSGNVSAAILYWQNNIKLSENKKIIATVEDKIDLHFLQNLPENDLFAITVLIQHESITIKDFAQVLNLTMDESMLIITSLLNRGIVIEKNGKFELHFFLYRPLMRILYEKRLLH
jgi:Fic family protein